MFVTREKSAHGSEAFLAWHDVFVVLSRVSYVLELVGS